MKDKKHKITIFNCINIVISAIIFIVLISRVSLVNAAFVTASDFEVNPDGSLGVNVKINSPPGTAGMMPNIVLSYNSNNGNGLAGLGWGLAGISHIARCPRTKVIDGVVGRVNFDDQDKFCIDGQRLLSTGGIYGANATEYKTESEGFSKIISYGVAGSGPSWFKVWTKSGQIVEYGNSDNSKIEASGKTSVRLWAANKVLDTVGNYIQFSYYENNSTGEAYVTKAEYTGNTVANVAPYASIEFLYESRVDTSEDYIGGSVIKNLSRLTNVKTFNGAQLVKDYKLTYTNNGSYHSNSSNNPDGSLLTKIQECDGLTPSNCLRPIDFTWVNGTTTDILGPISNWGFPANSEVAAVGDINGDGRDDVVYRVVNGNTAALYYSFSNGSSFSSGVYIASQSGFCIMDVELWQCGLMSWPSVFLSDVNGDGKADYLSESTIRIFDGTGFNSVANWLPQNSYIMGVGDVNGDGKSDVFYRNSAAQYCNDRNLYLTLSTGSGLNVSQNVGQVYCKVVGDAPSYFDTAYWFPIFVGDVNGDGLADLIIDNTSAKLSSGTTLLPPNSGEFTTRYGQYYFQYYPIYQIGDINGDGKSDVIVDASPIVYDNSSTVYISLSNGQTFSIASFVQASSVNFPSVCVQTFYDNDGMPSGCVATVYRQKAFIGDINGDGHSDFVSASGVRLATYGAPDLLISIANGSGNVTNIHHRKLSEPDVYFPDSTASYPAHDVLPIVPIYVVGYVTSSDGIGGSLMTNYQYGGLKSDVNRGSLGFRWIKTIDADSDAVVTSYYRQDYPYIGLVSSSEKRRLSDGTLKNASENTYANSPIVNGSATSQFPYVSQSVERSYELTGDLIATTTTTNQYDSFGNVLQVSVNSGDGYVKTTTNQYHNDTARWLLGRLLKSTVTTITP